jgi:hypothetical protein
VHGYTLEAIKSSIVFLAITAIVFNISINIRRKRESLLYLSKNGLEGLFYNIPILYYISLIIIIACLSLF